MLNKMVRLLDRILNFMAFLAGILLVFCMLSISLGVLSRYLLGWPISWIIEINEYTLLYITFLVAAWTLREDGHVKVDIVLNLLPNRKKILLSLFNSFIGLIVTLIITYYGALVSVDLLLRGVYNPTLLSFPKGPLVAIITIGTFFVALQFLRNIISEWLKFKNFRTPETSKTPKIA